MDFLESLSQILEQVGDTMTDISSKFAKGSEEFVQVTKIKMKISKTKDEIEYYLRDLGNIYYKQVKAIENDNGEDVVSLIEKIDACYEEIDRLKIELDFINKIRRDEELQFSLEDSLGTDTRDEISPPETEFVPKDSGDFIECPECGHLNSKELAICTSCGAEI